MPVEDSAFSDAAICEQLLPLAPYSRHRDSDGAVDRTSSSFSAAAEEAGKSSGHMERAWHSLRL